MGFFEKLFTKKDKNQPEKRERITLSENSGIPYNKELIKTLRKDHKTLLEMFSKILKLAQDKKYKTLKQQLKNFKIELEIHNYSKKVQLYSYLDNYYKNENHEDFIKDMAQSAEKIYQDMFLFLKKYGNIEFDNSNIANFIKELDGVGKILKFRISEEENKLYPLYKK